MPLMLWPGGGTARFLRMADAMFEKTCYLIFGILLLAGTAQAAPGPSLGYELIADKSGGMLLKGTARTASAGMWLGVTVYPSGHPETPVHLAYPLKNGYSVTIVEIAQNWVRGSFEMALWKERISKQQCDKSDAFCQKTGYRLYGMKSYIWGELVGP